MILKAGVTSLNNQRAAHYLITGLALVLPLSRLLISSLTILIVAFWIVQAKPWQHLKALINSKLGITHPNCLYFILSTFPVMDGEHSRRNRCDEEVRVVVINSSSGLLI